AHTANGICGAVSHREVCGDLKNRRRNVELAKMRPERSRTAEQFHVSTFERNPPVAELDGLLSFCRTRCRKIGSKGLGVAVDKIEDSVTTGIRSGDEARPGDRTLRRHRRLQISEMPLLNEALKIRHQTRGDESLQQIRIHSIHAENDDTLRN